MDTRRRGSSRSFRTLKGEGKEGYHQKRRWDKTKQYSANFGEHPLGRNWRASFRSKRPKNEKNKTAKTPTKTKTACQACSLGRAQHTIPGMHVSTRSSCSSTSTVRGILPASEASSSISCSLIFWKSTVVAVCRKSSKLWFWFEGRRQTAIECTVKQAVVNLPAFPSLPLRANALRLSERKNRAWLNEGQQGKNALGGSLLLPCRPPLAARFRCRKHLSPSRDKHTPPPPPTEHNNDRSITNTTDRTQQRSIDHHDDDDQQQQQSHRTVPPAHTTAAAAPRRSTHPGLAVGSGAGGGGVILPVDELAGLLAAALRAREARLEHHRRDARHPHDVADHGHELPWDAGRGGMMRHNAGGPRVADNFLRAFLT